jgi:predicted GNAT superfamily acetyltransferase
VFAHAKDTSVPLLTCEFDIEPPNPASAAFHAKWGFQEVGQQRAGRGHKLVSLQAASVHAHHEHS